MGAPINKFIGKVFIDGLRGGWQEVYTLAGEDVTAAKANMTALINGRKAMLSSKLTINYATVSDLGVTRDAYMAIPGPIDGSDTTALFVPNLDSDSFLIRQETGDGKGVDRHLRGVPDDVIDGTKYDATGAAGTYETALAAYLTLLKTHTKLLKKVTPADPTSWQLVAWADIFRRGISSHKVGRFFDTLRGRNLRA